MSELRLPWPAPDEGRVVVVHTAPDQLTAELLRGLLDNAGIPAALAAGDTRAYLGLSSTPCRILVPRELAAAARQVLDEQLGPTEDDQGDHA
jgi:putative signal transducing protein